MTARIRGQAAVPTEESPAQFRHRILTALGKLDDRDAQGRATDELKQVIDELTTEQLPALLGCLHDALAKAGSVHAKREHIRLFAVLCSVHGDAMAPHLPKAIAVIIKTLKEGDAQSVEVCVDALALMSKTVTSAVQPTAFAVPDEASYPLSVFLRPLFKLLTDQTKPSQSGAALALGRVLEANHRAIPGLLHHTMPLLLKALTLTYFVAGAQLLVAVQHCILGAREEVLEYVPALMDVLINTARSAQWTNRKAAFDTLRVLAQCLGAAMNSYRDDVLRLLNELRYDKIRAVREAVAGAQQTFQELGASLSPTKVPLREPEERPIRAHATVSRPAPSRASPAPSPLRSPAASRSHSSLGSRTPTKAAAKSTLTSLPVHVVASHSTSSSAASGDSATLEDIARTVHQMQAQQAAFMGEVRAHLERLDHRLRAVESRLPAAPRAAAAATDADVVAAEAVAESNGEAGPGAEAEEGEEDEAKLMARIAELEAEEEEANEGLED